MIRVWVLNETVDPSTDEFITDVLLSGRLWAGEVTGYDLEGPVFLPSCSLLSLPWLEWLGSAHQALSASACFLVSWPDDVD